MELGFWAATAPWTINFHHVFYPLVRNACRSGFVYQPPSAKTV
jgi:hypothetical protein